MDRVHKVCHCKPVVFQGQMVQLRAWGQEQRKDGHREQVQVLVPDLRKDDHKVQVQALVQDDRRVHYKAVWVYFYTALEWVFVPHRGHYEAFDRVVLLLQVLVLRQVQQNLLILVLPVAEKVHQLVENDNLT